MLRSVTGQPHLPEDLRNLPLRKDTGTILKDHFLLGREEKRNEWPGISPDR